MPMFFAYGLRGVFEALMHLRSADARLPLRVIPDPVPNRAWCGATNAHAALRGIAGRDEARGLRRRYPALTP
jgi:hypothetical protein